MFIDDWWHYDLPSIGQDNAMGEPHLQLRRNIYIKFYRKKSFLD